MTTEQLNTALYKKMLAEQETYRNWLLSQPAEEILKHAYEYNRREDILLSLEYNELSAAQAKALLRSPCPLEDIFQSYAKRENSYMVDIWETVEDRANDVIHQLRAENRSYAKQKNRNEAR